MQETRSACGLVPCAAPDLQRVRRVWMLDARVAATTLASLGVSAQVHNRYVFLRTMLHRQD